MRRDAVDRDMVKEAVRNTLLTLPPGRYKAKTIARIATQNAGLEIKSRDIVRHIGEFDRISVVHSNNQCRIYEVTE